MKKKNRVKQFVKNPKKALFKLALPIIAAMLVQVLYNVTDTIFVGRLGSESIAALTFGFPIFFLVMAISSGIGAGMSSRIARYLGEKKKKAAENTAMHGLLIMIFLGVITLVLGLLMLKPFFELLGAEPSVVKLSVDYMTIILYGVFFVYISNTISNIFSSQGDTKTPMKVHGFSLILNIILDPIFIFVFGFGVKGAAIATIISFFAAFLLFVYYLKKKSYIEINRKSFRFSKAVLRDIFVVGLPASLMTFLLSIFIMFINKFMAYFGTDYVASFGITARLDSIVFMPTMAISMSIMTLVGMFYGAKRYDLVKDITKYGIKIVLIFSFIMGLILFIFSSALLRIFTPETNLISLGTSYLRVLVFYLPFMTVTGIIGRAIQGMGYGLPGLVISFIRFTVPIPLAYVLVFIFDYGYLAVPFATIIGSIVSAIVAFIWLEYKFKKIHMDII